MSSAVECLKAIFWLQKEQGQAVSIGEIADWMDVDAPSVSEHVHTLATNGQVDFTKYRRVHLTKQGVAEAEKAVERNCIL